MTRSVNSESSSANANTARYPSVASTSDCHRFTDTRRAGIELEAARLESFHAIPIPEMKRPESDAFCQRNLRLD
jgi:hypothetical protein